MAKHLVIVESPAKARTLTRFLGDDFIVESSIGHVRDLPSKAAEIPSTHRGKSWARIGVDVDQGFKPLYIVPGTKKKQVKKLKDLLAKVEDLFLATDEDREGEAIAWHLIEVLKPKVPVKRMVFHEITRKAIEQALTNPRELDRRLVQAQEARRILDRLFGYEVSPVLWKKVRPRLSAGRVQSVATRLVVERERARMAFVSSGYWGLTASLLTPEGLAGPPKVSAELVELAGRRVALGRDFDGATGVLKAEAKEKGVIALGADWAQALRGDLTNKELRVADIATKPFTQKPAPPFITSTLQQESGRKLSFSAQRTMRVAQRLYENGYITYMRTDSTTLSGEALGAARKQISSMYGEDYLPAKPRTYIRKVKGAQEAHEAIRPAGEEFRTPEQVKGELDSDAWRLYELIWMRTMACQMNDARGERSRLRFDAELSAEVSQVLGLEAADNKATFQVGGKVIHFPGFLRAYVEGSDEPDAELGDKEVRLPNLALDQRLQAESVEALPHETKPPARFTEASLVKELERLGIGRPSTYASTIQTIQDRGYVWKRSGALVPTLTAFAVTRLLEKHFEELVDYSFTARMEDDLDDISSGDKEAQPWLRAFYFGEGASDLSPEELREAPLSRVGIKMKIEHGIEDIDARAICSLHLGGSGEQVVAARVGRYGPYLQVGDGERRANLPENVVMDELSLERAMEMLDLAEASNRLLGQDPDSELNVYLRSGRYGPYIQLGEQEKGKGKRKAAKPRMAGLWPGMEAAELKLADALFLLRYPKSLGEHPDTGDEIFACSGQYGPYLYMDLEEGDKRETRSLENHEQLRGINLAQALALFAEPKKRRSAGQSRSILAKLGESPVTGKEVEVRDGRFGPYVTDGQINASLGANRDPASLSLADAFDLIAAREQRLRDQGEDPRAAKKSKKPKKKAAKKTKKKAAKKTKKAKKIAKKTKK
ncbi:MAG: type I DNA topoisomerase [Deltaproteobacteria bacterium]|nr:type I DNA topoisomerase [Deltaproteobacteria bacterium]